VRVLRGIANGQHGRTTGAVNNLYGQRRPGAGPTAGENCLYRATATVLWWLGKMFFMMPDISPVESPITAVRAAIVADAKKGTK